MLTSSSSGRLLRSIGLEEGFRIFAQSGLDAMDWEDIIQAFKDVKYDRIMNLEVMPYLKNFPLDLYPEGMRRISVMSHYLAKRVVG